MKTETAVVLGVSALAVVLFATGSLSFGRAGSKGMRMTPMTGRPSSRPMTPFPAAMAPAKRKKKRKKKKGFFSKVGSVLKGIQKVAMPTLPTPP